MRVGVIVDTNVVVAGLLTASAESPVARVLDGMLSATFIYVVSEALLDEYRMVLQRPSLRKIHRLNMEQAENLVVTIAENAAVLAPVQTTPAPDPGDQHLWELLAARPDLQLVTGDKRLFQSSPYTHRIVTPNTFIAFLEPDRRHEND